MKEKKKMDKVCLALYIIGALFGIYTIFAMVNTSFYILDLSVQGLDLGANMANIVSYFVTACGPYLFYTVVLVVMGLEISKFHAYLDIKNGKMAEMPIETVNAVKEKTETVEAVIEADFIEVKEDDSDVLTAVEVINENDEIVENKEIKTTEKEEATEEIKTLEA